MISVVVPLLNEEENVPLLYERLAAVLAGAEACEIVFVDDGSTDGSVARIRELRRRDPRVRLISLSRNFGHQVALTAGLDHAAGDAVISLDADLQHPPEEIPRMIAAWKEGHEIVQMVRADADRRRWFKSLCSGWYYRLARWIAEVDLVPGASDFRLLDRRAVDALRSIREETRFLRGLVPWIGFRTKVLTYQEPARQKGRPKYSFRRSWQLAVAGILSLSVVPLRVATLVGMGTILLSIGYGIYVLWAALVRGHVIEGWTSLMMVVLVLGSLQITFLGIFGEYLARIHQATRRRPLYIIRESDGTEPRSS